MKMVRDRTGRFAERPYYEPVELDIECETLVSEFLRSLHGRVEWPISTDDLTKLLEEHVTDLDLFADLTALGPDVEGVTDFVPGRRPRVRIAASLSEGNLENRLRTTLTHELGHVHFHRYLFDIRDLHGDLFSGTQDQRPSAWARPGSDGGISAPSHQCRRETILQAPEVDWMEWQAGYACGAILMPIRPLRSLVHTFARARGLVAGVFAGTSEGQALIDAVRAQFAVSGEAARVRLLKTRLLLERGPDHSAFE